jgi:hypothetical protein
MSPIAILVLILLLLLLFGGLPQFGFHQYGYFPSGGAGLLLLILLVLIFVGRI